MIFQLYITSLKYTGVQAGYVADRHSIFSVVEEIERKRVI